LVLELTLVPVLGETKVVPDSQPITAQCFRVFPGVVLKVVKGD
jgi:hypothetical protein